MTPDQRIEQLETELADMHKRQYNEHEDVLCRIEKLEQELAELKRELQEPKPPERWRAEANQKFYVVGQGVRGRKC